MKKLAKGAPLGIAGKMSCIRVGGRVDSGEGCWGATTWTALASFGQDRIHRIHHQRLACMAR